MENPSERQTYTEAGRPKKRKGHKRGLGNEKYGSAEIRKPYLEASIGRLVLGDELKELTDRIGQRVHLQTVPKPALVYLPGNELASKTKFGTIRDDGLPRVSPQDTVNLALSGLQRSNILTKSSKEPVDIPFKSVSTKHIGNTGFRLMAIIGDVPTIEYPATGQLLAENATILRAFGSRQKDRLNPDPRHYIELGVGRLEEYDAVAAAILDNTLTEDTPITLGPVGYVHTPLDLRK